MEIAREAFDAWQARPWQDVLPPLSVVESAPSAIRWARWDRAYAEAAVLLETTEQARQLEVRVDFRRDLGEFGRRQGFELIQERAEILRHRQPSPASSSRTRSARRSPRASGVRPASEIPAR